MERPQVRRIEGRGGASEGEISRRKRRRGRGEERGKDTER